MSRIPNVQPARIACPALSAVLSLVEHLVERGVLPVEAGVSVIEQAIRDAGPTNAIGVEEISNFLKVEITRLRERFPAAS